LTACGANSQKDELIDRPDPEVPVIPEKPGPKPPVPPEPPGPIIPPTPPKPAPKVCVESHSEVEVGDVANSRADFVFYPGLSVDKLHSYKVSAGESTVVEDAELTDLTFPYQSISGSSLLEQVGFNNGEWQFETNSKNLLFKDTLTGEARQVSNFDFGGNRICSVTQIKPTTDRLSEFYISYGDSCSLTSKVNLAMSASDAAIQIPNPAIHEGTAIYDGDANWLGQLYKIIDQGTAKLVLQKPDFCSQNELLTFDAVGDAWSAKQFPDGSLLLQVGAKVYHLASADLLAWVADEPSFTLPADSLIRLPNLDQAVWLDKNASNIFYTSLEVIEDPDTKLDVIQNADLYVANLSTGAQEAKLSLYSGADSDKTIVGFEKVILDDESIWLETRFATKPATKTLYHRRYSRLNLTTNVLDSIAEFDYQLKEGSQKTEWHSIANKVYLKVNTRTSISLAINPDEEEDYLLQAGAAAANVDKVWYFIKQGSAIAQEADGVIAWDYTNHTSSQFVPELIKADGSSTIFPMVNRSILLFSMSAQFKDLSLFWDVGCTSGCDDAEPVAQYDYYVSLLKHADNSLIDPIYHERCTVVKATTDPVAPQSQTCTVNP
jgi:hypothetical protein